jgi:hypothetical protein
MTLAWGARVSAPFRQKVVAIATRLGCAASDLMACIAFETGETFSPSVRNPNSSATGLIQFMTGPDSWAVAHGYTRERLEAMTDLEQLDVVAEYFAPYTGRLRTLSDLYMAILWPKAVGAPEGTVIFPAGSKAYLANRGLDLNHDNAVTKAEAASLVAAKLAKGMRFGNVFDDGTTQPVPVTVQPVPIGTPPKEPRMGAALLAGLLPSILSLFSGRAQAAISKATGASPEVAAKFAEDISQQIQNVSGITVTDPASAMAAAGEIAKDPAKVAALEQHATGFVLTEVGGGVTGAREEYAAIARDLDDDVWWRIPFKFMFNPIHWVTGVFLFYIQQFIPHLAAKTADLDEAAAMGLIVLVFAVIGVVSARWMGVYPKQKE